jgi:hypothetical protein
VTNINSLEPFWPELIRFAGHMQARLEEKDCTDPDKMDKAYKKTPVVELEEELRNQVIQLGFAFRKGDKELIHKKAVDVANYCMMVYDRTE